MIKNLFFSIVFLSVCMLTTSLKADLTYEEILSNSVDQLNHYESQNGSIVWNQRKLKQTSDLKPKTALTPSHEIQIESAMTYHFSGGRFGDNLVAYFNTKWLARLHGVPFLFKHFPHSELLMLSEMDQPLKGMFHFANECTVYHEHQISPLPRSTLLQIPYFPDFKPEVQHHQYQFKYIVDWDDPEFKDEIRQALTPKISIQKISKPEGFLTVAVHVRRGGSYEPFSVCRMHDPLKFPPDSYYIAQIDRIAKMFPHYPIYVHIFTDDLNPEVIVDQYQKTLDNPHLKFGWSKKDENISDIQHLLNDFYSITEFDCLIRSGSNFSIMAGHLGNHKVIITPFHYHFNETEPAIDQIEIQYQ